MIYGLTYNGKICEFLTHSKFLKDLFIELLPDYRIRKQPLLSDSTFQQAKFMLKHAWKLELLEDEKDFVNEEDFTVRRILHLKRDSVNKFDATLIESNAEITQSKSTQVNVDSTVYECKDSYIFFRYGKLEIQYPATKEHHEAVQSRIDKLVKDFKIYEQLGLDGEELVNVYQAELEAFSI